MKSKLFLPIILLCSPLMLMGTNNPALVKAESATETIDVLADDGSGLALTEDVSFYSYDGDEKDATYAGTYLKFYGGYIQTVEPKFIAGGSTIDISLTVTNSGSYAGTIHGITAYIFNEAMEEVGKQGISPRASSKKTVTSQLEVSETGKYYIRLEAKSGATSSKYNKLYASSFTYTPYVEQAAPDISSDKFTSEKTLSQMAFSYSKSVVDENVNYNIDEVVLRYGAKIDYQNMWASLNVKSYGVALAKTDDLNGALLTELLQNVDLSDASVLASYENVKFAVGDVENVTRVNQNEDLFVEDAEGQYVLFNARVVVPETNYGTLVNAVAYVVFEEDGINKVSFFEEVVNDSVVNQANYYLENGNYDDEVNDVLSLLAK